MIHEQQSYLDKWIASKLRQMITHEGTAFLIGLSTFLGALVFFAFLHMVGQDVPTGWWWLAITFALLSLPTLFTKLRHSKEPYLVRFARAFRTGFWSFPSIATELSLSVFNRLWLRRTNLVSAESQKTVLTTEARTPHDSQGTLCPSKPYTIQEL